MANNRLRSFKNVAFFTSLVYIVVGLLLAIYRESVVSWMMTAAGVLLIVFGVIGIVKGNTVFGVMGLVTGILIIVCGWALVDLAMTVLGVLVAVKGFVDLVESLRMKKNMLPVIYSVLTVVAGVLLAVSKWVLLDWFFIIVGILLVVDGFFGLLGKKIF